MIVTRFSEDCIGFKQKMNKGEPAQLILLGFNADLSK